MLSSNNILVSRDVPKTERITRVRRKEMEQEQRERNRDREEKVQQYFKDKIIYKHNIYRNKYL
jgi:polynucleotide 5'-kinase involved in rRNA processing